MAALLVCAVSPATASTLDPTFGNRGVARLPVSTPHCAGFLGGLVRERNGSLVAAGTGALLNLVRWSPNGTRRARRTYGCSEAPSSPGLPIEPAALAVRRDGTIVVVGRGSEYTWEGREQAFRSAFSVGLFGRQLMPSRSFGASGVVKINLEGDEEGARAVTLLPASQIVAGGYAQRAGRWQWAMVRVSSTGVPVQSFGSGGVVVSELAGTSDAVRSDLGAGPPVTAINAIARLRDGRIVAVGTARDATTHRHRAAVARYLADGRLDPTFGGGDGQTLLSLPASEARGLGMALQGRRQAVIVAGAAGDPSKYRARFFATRLRADGTIDRSFGTSGVTTLAAGGNGATAVTVTPSNGMVLVGWVDGQLAVAKLDSGGDPDSSFRDGYVCAPERLDIIGGGPHPEIERVALVVQPGGRPVVAAEVMGPGTDDVTWVLARFKARSQTAGC